MVNYQLYLPKYFILIQHHYEKFQENQEEFEDSLIDSLFLGSLRGILDSMYNEFLYFRNPLHISKFCDFVYGWLGNYEVSSVTRQIKRVNKRYLNTDDKDDARTMFFTFIQRPICS